MLVAFYGEAKATVVILLIYIGLSTIHSCAEALD